jgi:hypothetical protein
MRHAFNHSQTVISVNNAILRSRDPVLAAWRTFRQNNGRPLG